MRGFVKEKLDCFSRKYSPPTGFPARALLRQVELQPAGLDLPVQAGLPGGRQSVEVAAAQHLLDGGLAAARLQRAVPGFLLVYAARIAKSLPLGRRAFSCGA